MKRTETVPFTETETETESKTEKRFLRYRSETSAAARTSWSGQDGAMAWAEFSRYPREAGIAGRRFVVLMDRLPLPALWYAVAEAAAEGHHAAGSLVEPFLRSRCARIGESLRAIEKQERADWLMDEMRPRLGMRSIADILGGAA